MRAIVLEGKRSVQLVPVLGDERPHLGAVVAGCRGPGTAGTGASWVRTSSVSVRSQNRAMSAGSSEVGQGAEEADGLLRRDGAFGARRRSSSHCRRSARGGDDPHDRGGHGRIGRRRRRSPRRSNRAPARAWTDSSSPAVPRASNRVARSATCARARRRPARDRGARAAARPAPGHGPARSARASSATRRSRRAEHADDALPDRQVGLVGEAGGSNDSIATGRGGAGQHGAHSSSTRP